MTFWKRSLKILLLLIIMNFNLLNAGLNALLAGTSLSAAENTLFTIFLRPALATVFILLFLIAEIFPCYEKGLKLRLQILAGGHELIITSIYALLAQLLILFFLWRFYLPLSVFFAGRLAMTDQNILILFWVNAAVSYFVLLFHYLNGFWRTAFCSKQLGITKRLLMLFFWWLFPLNLIFFYDWCRIVHRELITAKNRYLLDMARVENAVCRTKYPVMMVHGIFFRDWQYMNYWGRIPKALKRNGAVVYYGKQQSSLSVKQSAAELKEQIEHVLTETGAEKVNIIAHSKGGLDSRYAISKLGLADHVASLTTINTPHRGCQFADALLGSLPNWLIRFVAHRYNALFHTLGDSTPDFLAGVTDLTAAACAKFNEEVPDAAGVYYQSVMSKMGSHKSTFFPLSLSYFLVKKYEGENDGLVSVPSASWGNYLGLLKTDKKGRGISHADMIDLTHKDLRGFDVSEFYVRLFEGLKEKGF